MIISTLDRITNLPFTVVRAESGKPKVEKNNIKRHWKKKKNNKNRNTELFYCQRFC